MADYPNDIFGYKIDFINELGRGAFGIVYKGVGADNSVVAVKKICRGPRRIGGKPAQKP